MIDLSTDADGIADFLSCLANLERKNSQLFKNLEKKVTLSSVKPLLRQIALDNSKHAKILDDISTHIGNPKIKTKECKKRLSIVCQTTESLLEKIENKNEINPKQLSRYMKYLESSGGAAQYLLAQAETFLFLSKKIRSLYGMKFSNFNQLLNEIVRDIEEQIRLLEEINQIIENKNVEESCIQTG